MAKMIARKNPDLELVLLRLPKLAHPDLHKVIDRAKYLLSNSDVGDKVTVRSDPIDDYLLDGIHNELRQRGLLSKDDRIHYIPAVYKTGSRAVRDLLEERIGALAPEDRMALGRLSAQALANLLDHNYPEPIPVTAGTLLKRVRKIPEAIDRAYPGYLAGGLLRFCFK